MAAESAAATTAAVVAVGLHRRTSRHCLLFGGPSSPIFSFKPPSRHHLAITATNEKSKNIDLSSPDDPEVEKLEVDKIVDGMDFGDLCNEFECISSPSVEATARQLARDILELREGNRTLGTYAVSVKYKFSNKVPQAYSMIGCLITCYKLCHHDGESYECLINTLLGNTSTNKQDPVRSFTGREKYKRPRWAIDAFDKPSVIVLEMVMLSTSVLNIKWLIKGIPKSLLGRIGGEFTVKVNSKFTLNQISGQVIEHEESWDLSAPSVIAQSYFWVSRRLFAMIEAGRDITDSVKNLSSRFDRQKENLDIYPDPLGDPTKFFQRDDGFQRDVYEIALFIAVIYFVVQFLRTTL